MKKPQFDAIGRLAADPEVRYTPQGTAVANARVAINDGYPDKDGNWIDRTIWATLTFWGKLAEAIGEKAHKGDQIDFRASLVYDEKTGAPKLFESKGKTGAKFEFRVNEYTLFPKNGSAPANAPAEDEEDVQTGKEGDEDFPF